MSSSPRCKRYLFTIKPLDRLSLYIETWMVTPTIQSLVNACRKARPGMIVATAAHYPITFNERDELKADERNPAREGLLFVMLKNSTCFLLSRLKLKVRQGACAQIEFHEKIITVSCSRERRTRQLFWCPSFSTQVHPGDAMVRQACRVQAPNRHAA